MSTNPTAPATPAMDTYWARVEYLRRLYKIIDETSVAQVVRETGIAKASLYRWMWGERQPSTVNLRALYTTYPNEFPEFKILMEEP